MKFRFYLRLDEGLRRVPLNALAKRSVAPHLAGTRQMAIEAAYEWRGIVLFLKTTGYYFSFNERGVVDISLEDLRSTMEVVEIASEIAYERQESPKVASIALRRREKALESQISWTVSPAEFNLIAADLVGKLRPAGTSGYSFAQDEKALTTTSRIGLPTRTS